MEIYLVYNLNQDYYGTEKVLFVHSDKNLVDKFMEDYEKNGKLCYFEIWKDGKQI